MQNKKVRKKVKKLQSHHRSYHKVWVAAVILIFVSSTLAVSGFQSSRIAKDTVSQPVSEIENDINEPNELKEAFEIEKPPNKKPKKDPEPEPAQPEDSFVQEPEPEKEPVKQESSTTPTAVSSTPQETASSFAYINSVRSSAGKSALVQNSTMNQWAQAHTNKMAKECSLYHQSLGQFLGVNIGPVVTSSVAENVGFAPTIPEVLDGLKNSAGHYANMIGDYLYVGIGVASSGDSCPGRIYTTQIFAK